MQTPKRVLTIPENLIFPRLLKNFKFHDISMIGKAPVIFQGFPGAVETLHLSLLKYQSIR